MFKFLIGVAAIMVAMTCVIFGSSCSQNTTSSVTATTSESKTNSPVPSTLQSSSIPNVKIQSVTLPSNAKISTGTSVTNFDTTFRLINSESFDVTVDWQVDSSINGKFDGGSVIVPNNSFKDVTKAYYYTVPGPVKMTYTLKYGGTQIDSWSGNLNVALPDIKIQSVTLPSNAKVSTGASVINFDTTFRLVNAESFDVTVDWQVDSSINGKFDNGNVIVPKNGFKDVTKAYHYTVPGTVKMTYTVKCGGTQIATWSGDMIVLP